MTLRTVLSDSTRPSCFAGSQSHPTNAATPLGVISVSFVRSGKNLSAYCSSIRR
jgi:hypothetical protein